MGEIATIFLRQHRTAIAANKTGSVVVSPLHGARRINLNACDTLHIKAEFFSLALYMLPAVDGAIEVDDVGHDLPPRQDLACCGSARLVVSCAVSLLAFTHSGLLGHPSGA